MTCTWEQYVLELLLKVLLRVQCFSEMASHPISTGDTRKALSGLRPLTRCRCVSMHVTLQRLIYFGTDGGHLRTRGACFIAVDLTYPVAAVRIAKLQQVHVHLIKNMGSNVDVCLKTVFFCWPPKLLYFMTWLFASCVNSVRDVPHACCIRWPGCVCFKSVAENCTS